ncbi:MAG TPA: acetate--CoA ligase family protein, partial [Thermoanaerobaculia bacterium]|nr:acetate--CoA ligase family protein [Thermoanaerobaculia bacterium]
MSGAVTATAAGPAEIFRAARQSGRATLLEHEVYAVLTAAGFDVPRYVFWPGAPGEGLPGEVQALLAAAPGDDVVLKIVAPGLLHKSDVGGVAFAPRDPSAVLEAARRVHAEVGRRAPEAARSG